MAKTNFTKVEEALAEGLRKMEVNKLLDIADENSAKPEGSADVKPRKLTPEQTNLLATMKHDLKKLNLAADEICAKLQVEKSELKKLFKESTNLTEADWAQLDKIKERLMALKAELDKKGGTMNDETLVEEQRKRQKNKRFNVSDKWLPLK